MRATTFVVCFIVLLIAATGAGQQHVGVVGDFPGCQEIALDSSASRVYATVGGSLGLAVIDGNTHALVATVPTNVGPWGVAFNPLTNRVYVANQTGGGVTVVDAATDSVRTTIDPFRRISGVLVDVRTNRIYATEELSTNLLIIDGVTDMTIAVVALPVFRPALMALNPATNHLYVTNNSAAPVVVVDVATNAVVNTIPAALGTHVAVDRVNQRLYFAEVFTQRLDVIDLATETVTTHVIDAAPLASDPLIGVGYNAHTNHIFVSRALSHTVVALDAATFAVIATIPSGNFGIAVNESTDTVYVCERGESVPGDPPAPGRVHIISDTPAVLTVTIDVHPETIQLRANGVVTTAIFSTSSFDATKVDPATVRLAGAPAIRSAVEDVDGDGLPDLIVQVTRSQLQLTTTDTKATLTGATYGGQRIAGSDTVRVIR